jgi:hypothetical protein
MTRPHEREQDVSGIMRSSVRRLIETERSSVEARKEVQLRDKLYQQSVPMRRAAFSTRQNEVSVS